MLGYLAKGMKFADGIDVTNQLAWRREVILIIRVGPTQPHGGGRQQREALWETQPLLALKMEEGPRIQKCQQPLEAGRGGGGGREWLLPWSPCRRKEAMLTP